MQKYCRLQYFCSFVNHSSFIKQYFCIQITDAALFSCFKRKTYTITTEPNKIWVEMSTRCKVSTISEMKLESGSLSETGAIFLRKANYNCIGCAIYLHSNNKFALSHVNKLNIQYFCFLSKILECKLLVIVGTYEDNN